MNRSLRALIRKTFGKNHSMRSQASVITLVACLGFVIVVLLYFSSIMRMWYERRMGDDGNDYDSNVVMVNAPDSFREYAKSKYLNLRYGIKYKKTDAYYDVFTFSKWMDEYDAYMVIVFEEDFDEKALEKYVPEKPEILTFISTDHLEYASMRDEFLEEVFDNRYYRYLSDELGVTLPEFDTPWITTEALERPTYGNMAKDRLFRLVVPMLFFIFIMYVCMMIGMNAIAGEKERGTFAALLMTPMTRGTIVLGNFLGVLLHALIPCGILVLLIIFGTPLSGVIGTLFMALSLAIMIAAITILISCMSNSIVSAQTAFLPIFLIVLVACVSCMNTTSPNPINYYLPIYGHFYGIGDCLMGTMKILPIAACCLTSVLLAVIALLVSRRLLQTEMFTVAVESKSDKELRKAAARAKKEADDYVSRARANVFGYRPRKRKPLVRFLFGHAMLPLALLSVFQTLAMIPAIVSYMKTTESVRFLNMFRDISGLGKVRDVMDESAALFSEFMSNKYFILFMGIGYWCIIGAYMLIVRFGERNKLSTMGFSSGKALSEQGKKAPWKMYLMGMGLGFLMISCVYIVMFVTGQVSFKGFALSSDNALLFIFYILMWIPQGATEEIMMRGYMMPRIAGRLGVPFAVFFSSFCFSIMHASNAGFSVLAMINLVLIAALFALIALRDGHIYRVCAMHTLWNFCQGNLFGLEVSGNPQSASIFASGYTKMSSDLMSGGAFGPEGGLCVTIVIAIAFIIFFVTRKNEKPANV